MNIHKHRATFMALFDLDVADASVGYKNLKAARSGSDLAHIREGLQELWTRCELQAAQMLKLPHDDARRYADAARIGLESGLNLDQQQVCAMTSGSVTDCKSSGSIGLPGMRAPLPSRLTNSVA